MTNNNSVTYTYVMIWTAFRTIKHLYDDAWGDPLIKNEALALRLAALNMSISSLEESFNHFIQAINPEVWSQERQYFFGRKKINGKKYYEPFGKLKYVHFLCYRTYGDNAVSIHKRLQL